MASHAGLVLVFRTKEGYINEVGEVVKDKKQARRVSFYEVGFSGALEVYKKLGFDSTGLTDKDIYLETLECSYDSRLGSIESLYKQIGMNYCEASNAANDDFHCNRLEYYDNYIKFINALRSRVISRHKCKDIDDKVIIGDKLVNLRRINGYNGFADGEVLSECFYSDTDEVAKLSIDLKNPHIEKHFQLSEEEIKYYNNWQNDGLIEFLKDEIMNNLFECRLPDDFKIFDIAIKNSKLCIYINYSDQTLIRFISEKIRDFYSEKEMHITRMFGSYVVLQRLDGELKAVRATPVPIKYCPLMVKLLKEVGGVGSEKLIEAIRNSDTELQTKMMCELINEIVIKGGYFDTNRPLNSCEANVLFGASETISSAFKSDILDAAVIVSNNLGTIITTNDTNTQGAVKRMTGLFYTSPSKTIVEEARKSKIIPVFPYTATIDQIEGVKKAIREGYKKIAVTFAAGDNEFLEQVKELEVDGVRIYKFGLCSTGINEKTARIMLENADIIWSCASKYVKELIEPNAIAQVGIKIPVHIMTKKGWELVRNHLEYMINDSIGEIELTKGEDKPVFLHGEDGIKRLIKKEVGKCGDCPHPCI